LFLFVVMMLDINFVKLREGFLQYLPFGALLGIVLIVELGILFLTKSFSENSLSEFISSPEISEIENTKLIGRVLYTDYFYLFQISGLILLVAMVGSITLTLRDRGQVKRQNISSQNFMEAKSAIEKKKIKLGEGI
ncbi:MAG: NADH-quinone oxidoreductase subunit J, partial [Pelagibacteraceae bacterium]|nr:NADH-quinone oxidoreductase subunit J [Pelagibacteraceae bacterium]